MKHTWPKFKVIELELFVSFKFFSWFCNNKESSEQDAYNFCKELFDSGDSDRDNPFYYIEECEDPGFPPRAGLKYCVRTNKKCIQYYYKPYVCYCYQAGRWWKFKEDQCLFTDVYVPQLMSHYDYTKYNQPRKFLSKAAYNDWMFHLRSQELRSIRRNVDKHMIRFDQDKDNAEYPILIDGTWCDSACPYFQIIEPGPALIARCNKLGQEPLDYYDGFIAACQTEEPTTNE